MVGILRFAHLYVGASALLGHIFEATASSLEPWEETVDGLLVISVHWHVDWQI
jgi:hypothetical protein